MSQENRMFEEMLKAAKAWLAGRDPRVLSDKGRIDFDGTSFHLHSLGRSFRIDCPDYAFTPAPDEWHRLAILHYLHLADGTPLTGRPITFAQQKGGMVRGGGFDRRVEDIVGKELGILEPRELERKCRALGGKTVPSNADFCAVFNFLPMYPITLKIWFADEEFGASGRMLLDGSAEHYLTIEDSVMAGELLLEALKNA